MGGDRLDWTKVAWNRISLHYWAILHQIGIFRQLVHAATKLDLNLSIGIVTATLTAVQAQSNAR